MTQDKSSRREFMKTTGAAGALAVATLGFVRPSAAAAEVGGDAITQLASFKLNMEKEVEAVEMLQELCKAVEENEPGVLAYICHRSAKEPEKLVFFEIYENQDAVLEHMRQPHMAKMRQVFGTLLLPPLELTRLNRLGGFSR